MKLKMKSLCGMKKSVFKLHFDQIEKIVCKPKYVCSKCARVARDDSFLCRPKKLGQS